MKKLWLITASLIAFSSAAQAQVYGTNGNGNYNYYYGTPQKKKISPQYFTLGLDYVAGMTSMEDGTFTLSSPLPGGSDYTGNNDQFEDSIHSLSGSFGVRPFRYFGLEAYYQQSLSDNEVKHQEHYKDYPLFAQSEYSIKYKAYGLDAIVYLPVATRLELLVSGGIAHYEFDATAKFSAYRNNSGTPEGGYSSAPYKVNENKTIFRYGAGAQIVLTNRLNFRVMYHYSQIGGEFVEGMHDVTVGVRYKF